MEFIPSQVKKIKFYFFIYFYRFDNLHLLRQFQVPFVLLSATVPKKFEKYFFGQFVGLKVIRNKYINRNIEYNVAEFDSTTEILSELQRKMSVKYDFPSEDKNVSVVFCRTINMANSIMKSFKSYRTCIYHGEMDESEKRIVEQDVFSGKVQIVFATIAFGLGIDLPGINLIFMVGIFDSVFDIIQMAGRGGRNGSTLKCQANILFTRQMLEESNKMASESSSRSANFANSRTEDRQILEEWLLNNRRCRLSGLSEFLHDKYTDCGINSNPFCDVCKRQVEDSVPNTPKFSQNLMYSVERRQAPPSPVIVSRAVQAEDQIAKEIVLLDSIIDICKEFSGKCVFCMFQGKTGNIRHALHLCPNVTNYCLKCFGTGHSAAVCLFKRLPQGVCFMCGMKNNIGKRVIHEEVIFGKSCTSFAKDIVLPLLALIYRKGKLIEPFGKWRDDQLLGDFKFLSTISAWYKESKPVPVTPTHQSLKRTNDVLSSNPSPNPMSSSCFFKRSNLSYNSTPTKSRKE